MPESEVLVRLKSIERKLDLIHNRQETAMGLIDDLQAKMDAANASIQKNTDLDDSIIAMLTAETQQIKDLKAALDAAGTDPAKLQALGEAMDALIAKSDAEAQKKADAVTANTPAA
jgi:chromosome segregation ATPase